MNKEEGAADPNYDEIMAKQAELLAEKMKTGVLKKKQPLLNKDKKQFDSADYFKDKETHGNEAKN